MENAGRNPKLTVFQKISRERPRAAEPAAPPMLNLVEAAKAAPPEAAPAHGSGTPDAVADPEVGGEEINDAAYGYFRGRNERASDIEFQKRDGSCPALGYAWLHYKNYLPASAGDGQGQTILLEYTTGLKVAIRGRNLRPLYVGILRQQVFRVTEMGEDSDRFLPEEALVVYGIEVALPEPAAARE